MNGLLLYTNICSIPVLAEQLMFMNDTARPAEAGLSFSGARTYRQRPRTRSAALYRM